MDLLKWARYHWDRVAAAILVGLGLLALLLGYLGVSGTVYPAEQLPYMISGGILGLFCLGTAALLYLSADMRDEWRKLDSIDESLKQLTGRTTRDADDDAGTAPADANALAPVDTSDIAAAMRSTASVEDAAENGNGSKPRAAARKTSKPRSTAGQSSPRRTTERRTGARS
jgi:hypothetical protein